MTRPEPPVEERLKETGSGFGPLVGAQTVLLICRDEGRTAKVREALPQGCELVTARGGEAGRRAARLCAPDLILIDQSAGYPKLRERLLADPLTSGIPVLLVDAELFEGDDALEELGTSRSSLNPVELRGRIASIFERGVGGPRLLHGDLGEATLLEVVEFVEGELRQRVLEAAGPVARDAKVRLGDSGELMSALWTFVARFRQLLSQGSDGRVVFHDSELSRLRPITLATADENLDEDDIVDRELDSESIAALRGMRAVVADDDAEVRALFSAVLGEVGVTVETVNDGRAALEAITKARPDVLITDILMPEMDGWELLRRVRRDVLLHDLPIVVLSWKDDFLQRIRELGAGADEYMQKEVDQHRLLVQVGEVLAPRWHLDRELAAKDECFGRVEAVGVVPLLRAVARRGGDRLLSVREAWNHFEIEFLGGRVASMRNTTRAGRILKGQQALTLLLGVVNGRFVVARSPSRSAAEEATDLDELLLVASRPVQRMIDAVNDGALVRVSKVKLHLTGISEYVELSPSPVRQLIGRLARGESPREIILSGDIGARELERILVDLIRRGGVEQIEGPPLGSELLEGSPEDQARWAMISGDQTKTKENMVNRREPSVVAQVDRQNEEEANQSQIEPRSRILIYLAILAVVVLGLYLFGESRDPPAVAPTAPVAPAAPMSSP